MKIGIDCRMFSLKFGIGRYTHELVDQIIKLNSKLKKPHQLILFFNNPDYHEFRTIAPIKKILVNAPHYSFAEQSRFLRKLNKEKLDIVHFPHFNVPIFYRRPYTVTIHDLTLSLFPGQKMTSWYHRLAYHFTIKNATRRAKHIIAVSHNTKKDLIARLKTPEQKITVVHNGISPDFRQIKRVKKKPFLLYTGVWRTHKNLPRLIEAFHILRNEKKLGVKLFITGKADPHYPEVKNTVKKFGLERHVVFTGPVEEKELVLLYNRAAIFVFPSLYEGFGLPPLEAMRCGTPVAASNISSIPEVCGYDNAVFFDPKNPEDIAEKIYMVYKNPNLQATLVDRGLKHSARFSLEKMAAATFKIICSNRFKNS